MGKENMKRRSHNRINFYSIIFLVATGLYLFGCDDHRDEIFMKKCRNLLEQNEQIIIKSFSNYGVRKMGGEIVFYAQTDSSYERLVLVDICNNKSNVRKPCWTWDSSGPSADSMEIIYKRYQISLEKVKRIYFIMDSLKFDGFTSEFANHGLRLRLYTEDYVINYFPDLSKATNHYRQTMLQQPLIKEHWYLEKRNRE